MNKETLKELVKNILGEESEYKEFFKKALDKAGKSIPDMSDDEKKAFFNKIDATWDGKGEKKTEGNTFGAERAKAIASGDDSFKVDGKSFKVTGVDAEDKENAEKFTNEGIGTIALGVAGGLLLLKVLKFVVKKVLGAIGMNAPLPKEKLHKTTDELFKQVLVTGGKLNMGNFMALRSVIKEMIDKDQITTLSQIIKVIEKASNEEPKNESVNESELPSATLPASIKAKLSMAVDKIKDSKLSYNQKVQVVGQVMDSLGIDKSEFAKMSSKLKGAMGSSNEGNTFGAERAKAIAKGDDSFEVDGKAFKVTGVDAEDKENAEKFANESIVNEEKYTVIDPKGNQMGASDKMQATMIAKKKGGEKEGYFVVSNKNALKARRALEKFKGDFKNPKLKDMMADLFYESVESVNEATLEQGTKLRYDKNSNVVDYVVDKKYTGRDGFPKYILKVVKSNYPNKIKVGSTEEYDDSRLTGLIRNRVMSFVKNESVNEATLINLKNNSDAQTIAAKSKLSYEDSWNAITSYLVATMGLPKALALVLKLEKEYDKIFSESKINEATTSSAPGEWVAYLSMTRGKKLLNTFNTARGAKQFLSKNVDKLLGGANVESVGIMSKKQWDEREAKYAVESVNEAKNLQKAKQALIDFNSGKLGEDAMVKTVIKSLGFKFDEYSEEEAGMVLGSLIKKGKIPTDNYVLNNVIDVLEESVNEASKPTIKVVSKLKNEEGIQIVVTKTTDGDTMYGGFVVRGKLQKVIPVGANNSKESVQKRALQIWDEFGKQLGENINEGNAFGMAVTKAKKEGLKEFEFNGKMYKVKEGSYEKNEAAKKPVVLSGFALVPEKKK